MRVRIGLTAVLVALALAACTSSHSSKPPASGSVFTTARGTSGLPEPVTPYCARLIAAAPKINTAQAALYSGKNSDAAVATVVGQLTALESGAPDNVKAALADMITQFQAARDILQRPTMATRDRIAVFGGKISADNRVLSTYVSANCTQS